MDIIQTNQRTFSRFKSGERSVNPPRLSIFGKKKFRNIPFLKSFLFLAKEFRSFLFFLQSYNVILTTFIYNFWNKLQRITYTYHFNIYFQHDKITHIIYTYNLLSEKVICITFRENLLLDTQSDRALLLDIQNEVIC
jgi:hypothetical protein